MTENTNANLIVYGKKQYMLDDVLKLVGTNGEKALKYFKDVIPKCGDVIPAEYTSRWLRTEENKKILLPYTIGEKTHE